MGWIVRLSLTCMVVVVGMLGHPPLLRSQALSGPLVVFNAGSLAAPFRDLLQAFRARHPGVRPLQESSGSLEAARKLTELGKVPDVLGVADYLVIPKLLIPSQATWYVGFARNAMVLIYSRVSIGSGDIDAGNWHQILRRPGVRTGRSDPSLDPNGYRTLLALQLTEAHLRQPGLAARLLAVMPARWMRPKEADLVALVQAGELDYAWSYRSIAMTSRLPFVTLPPEVDLSDPQREAWYRQATVRLPGPRLGSTDSITVPGEPIVYAMTIPTRAPNPRVAAAFVRFALSAEGRTILERNGLTTLRPPQVGGPGRPPPAVLP
ncbi:MAG: substrate-binding domain-containing protein [Gemmatimonadota bacterium]|nr:substrate-binding domain-containing protein [Gemmatimonadota bacterium]